MSVSHSENESWNKKGVRYCGKWIMLWKDLVIVTSHHERNHWLAMLISRTWECKSLVTNVLCCPGSLHLERWIQVLKISHLSNCFFPQVIVSFGISGCWNIQWKSVAYKWMKSKKSYFTLTDLKTRIKCSFQKEHFSFKMLLLSHFHCLMYIILILLVSL